MFIHGCDLLNSAIEALESAVDNDAHGAGDADDVDQDDDADDADETDADETDAGGAARDGSMRGGSSSAVCFRQVRPVLNDTPSSLQREYNSFVRVDGAGGYHLRRGVEATRGYVDRLRRCLAYWQQHHRDDLDGPAYIRRVLRRLERLL